MEAVLLCGLPGAGKSTFARGLAGHEHLCADRLGAALAGRVEACLAAGRPFVLDDLNATAADRARWVAAARAAGFRVTAYDFRVRASTAVRRNQGRGGALPWGAVIGTARRLESPGLAEGLDAVWRVAEDGSVAAVAARADARAA